jgi:hypothetical protein
MKKIFIFMILLCSVAVNAQEITVDLNNFTQAEISNGLKVKFIKAEENKAVITGDKREEVKLKVEEGVLKINMSINHIWNEDNTLVDVYYKQLNRVEAKQGSRVEIKTMMRQAVVSFRAKEGSEILADVNVEDFSASAVTGGQLKISGTADQQEIDVSSAGEFKGENLIGKDVDVTINGGGTANVFSKEFVKARVRAGGSIFIYGDPVRLDQATTLGGTIKNIN